jgi:hypothetical protein
MLLKKSLTHAGVLICLIVLVVLLLVNWNKCIANPLRGWFTPKTTQPQVNQKAPNTAMLEGFVDIDGALGKGVDPRDITIDLEPTSRQVKVAFTGVDAENGVPTGYAIKSYLMVLAKYDKDLNKVGTLDVKLSEEAGARTFVEDLAAFTKKYDGSLSQARITAMKDTAGTKITDTKTSSQVLQAFLGDSSKTGLKDLNALPTQEIGMFFELLGLVYKTQLTKQTKTLKDLYTDLVSVYPYLPPIPSTTNAALDRNYDYLAIDTDNKKGAADLKRAIASLKDLNEDISDPVPTNTNTTNGARPSQAVINALKAFMEELIRMAESDPESATGNICDAATNKCNYTFTQVEPADPQGNIYYYKLGVGVIFVSTTDGTEKISKIKAYSFGSGNKLQYFRVDTALNVQERMLKRLDELDRTSMQRALQQPAGDADGSDGSANGASSQMDAYLNMLKPYVGNYPDEYILGTETGKELTLDKYLNQSLAVGQVNINADLTGLTPKTTAMAGSV